MKGSNHDPNCRYTIDGEMKDIYAKQADSEYLTKDGNKYIVRLLFTNTTVPTSNSELPEGNNATSQKKQVNYIPSGKKAAYLSTIKRILKLRAALENDQELQRKVILKFNIKGNTIESIPWNNFFFDVTNEDEAERLIHYLNIRNAPHPMCLCGKVSKIAPVKDDRYRIELLNHTMEKNEKLVISFFADEKVIRKYQNLTHPCIAVYCNVKAKDSLWVPNNPKQSNSQIIYHNIDGNIYDSRQINLLSED